MKKIGLVFLIALLTTNLFFPYLMQAAEETKQLSIEKCLQDREETFADLFKDDCLFNAIQNDELAREQYVSVILENYDVAEEEALRQLDHYINEQLSLVKEEDLEEGEVFNPEDDLDPTEGVTAPNVEIEEDVEEFPIEEELFEEEENREKVVEEEQEETVEEEAVESTEEGTEEVEAEDPSDKSMEEDENIQPFALIVDPLANATSKKAQVRSNTTVVRNLGDNETIDPTPHLNRTFFVKQEATYNGDLYLLISTQASATSGVVGWAKASELTSHTHQTVDRENKTFYLSGRGVSYTTAWGGTTQLITTLSGLRGERFDVHLTESIGNNIWYRGDVNGQRMWIHSNHLHTNPIVEDIEAVSKKAQIRSNTLIYKELGDANPISNVAHQDRSFFVKEQAIYNGETYLHLSTQASAVNGVIGWARASEVTSHEHRTVDRDSKTFTLSGRGVSYNTAWGGKQNLVKSQLSDLAGATFQVHLTESIGNNIWYRGDVNGERMWIHSNHLNPAGTELSSVSRKGMLSMNTTIFTDLRQSGTVDNRSYLNRAFFIKQQATVNGELYYLLSTQASAVNGLIGWVRESEIVSAPHVQIDRTSKVRYVSGEGAAFNTAWGGSANKLFDLSSHKNARFDVHLTEQVGNEVWYRGMLNGQQVWIKAAHVNEHTYKSYNISLEEAAQRQHGVYAVTDTYRQFVSAEYISYNSAGNYYYVNTDVLNVRSGPSTAYAVVDRLTRDTRVTVRGNPQNGWYQLHWVRASVEDIAYYMNPNNFINDERQKFQFLDLTQSSGVTAEVLNRYLQGKGTLSGQGQAFIDAGQMHGVNEIYLLSHALLETGHGTSFLASGNEYNGTIVYNMFGIGAVDACPNECGLERAYNEGWDSPYKAIVGGASFIGNNYVKSGQNTLYKMRWNIDGLIENGRPTHQYATDIGWAFKQVNNMYTLYQEIGSYNLVLEIPRFDG
ncbi:N-acetylglucosaminidase [Shouchella hunanensis]|uniref:Glucosaminidase domain-containing protein n=1 Tax=Shouchella hunanensis TaxID=766894 RepID=A0ABY7W7Q0_9BACI|nr:GW dipeptide domain-containing protein [Shouchella hunanensis]WDF04955.1 glucosaminidase domain-containing protein [Shouchella hunanensis]